MNIDLAFKGFLRLLKSVKGEMRGGKYLNRKWTGKRWDYEYMGQKKKSSKDTSTPSLFAESGIANKTSVNPVGQDKPVALSQESRAAASSATQIPLFGKKKVEGAKPSKPSFSLVQEDKTSGEKKNAVNASQSGLFGKKTDSEAFTKKDFKPEFKLEGDETISSLVTNVKNALLKEGLDTKAREFVDKAFKEKDLDSIKNLASQYVDVKGDLVTKPTSGANSLIEVKSNIENEATKEFSKFKLPLSDRQKKFLNDYVDYLTDDSKIEYTNELYKDVNNSGILEDVVANNKDIQEINKKSKYFIDTNKSIPEIKSQLEEKFKIPFSTKLIKDGSMRGYVSFGVMKKNGIVPTLPFFERIKLAKVSTPVNSNPILPNNYGMRVFVGVDTLHNYSNDKKNVTQTPITEAAKVEQPNNFETMPESVPNPATQAEAITPEENKVEATPDKPVTARTFEEHLSGQGISDLHKTLSKAVYNNIKNETKAQLEKRLEIIKKLPPQHQTPGLTAINYAMSQLGNTDKISEGLKGNNNAAGKRVTESKQIPELNEVLANSNDKDYLSKVINQIETGRIQPSIIENLKAQIQALPVKDNSIIEKLVRNAITENLVKYNESVKPNPISDKFKEEQERKANEKLAYKFQYLADSMEKTIDSKINSAIGRQNLTARRARISGGMYEEGQKLKQVQSVLRGMANAVKNNDLPQELQNVKSRKDVDTIVRYAILQERENNQSALPKWQQGRSFDYTKDNSELRRLGITSKEKLLDIGKIVNGLQKGYTAPDPKLKKIKDLETKLIGQKIPDFFPTPKRIIDDMISRVDIQSGMKVLEPSAGKGDIADALKNENVEVDTIEPYNTLQNILKEKGHNVVADDFLEFNPGETYDRIVMNPPFGKGADMAHVKHAYDLLKPGGRLVAIMGEGAFFRSDNTSKSFRDWLDSVPSENEKLPEKSFTGNESFRQTGVNTRMVTIDKPMHRTLKSTFSNIFKSLFLPTAKINLFGLPITIERKRGTYRTGKGANGIPWATKLDSDYGYIRRTYGADGEHIDCYVGQNPHSELVFVVNQKFPTGRFDEHKVMLGYDSKDAAIQSYLANNPKAKNLFDSMEVLTLPQFKQWLMTGSKQRKMEVNIVKFKSSLAEKLLMKANGYTYIKKERHGNRWKYWYKDDATGAVTTTDEAKDKQDGEPKQLTFMDSIKNFFKGDVKKAKEEYQKDFHSIGQGTPETSFQAQYKEYFTNKEKIDSYLKSLAEKRGQAVKPATKNDTTNVKGTDENAKKKLTIQAAIQRMPKKIPGTNIDVNVAKKLYEKYGNGAIKDNFDTMPEGEKKKSEKSVEDYKKYFNVHSVDYLEEMKDMYSNDPFGGDNTNKLKAIDEVINQKTGKDSETKPVDNKENPDSKFKVKTESGNEWDLRNDPKNEKHKEAFGKLTANDHKEIAKKHTEIGKTMSDRKQKIHHSDMSYMHSKKAYEASKSQKPKEQTPKKEKVFENTNDDKENLRYNNIIENIIQKSPTESEKKFLAGAYDFVPNMNTQDKDYLESLAKKYNIDTKNEKPKAANTPKPKLSLDERKKKVSEMSAKVKQVQAQAAEHLADKKIESESNRLEENHSKYSSSFKVKPANEIKTKSQYTSEDNYDKPVIEGIKQSILANGYDQSKPITIDSDGFVVDGHHRFTAVSELIKDGKLPKDTPIPTITKTYENEAERLMDQVSANKMRRTVNIMDDAKAYSSLVAQGKTPQEISDRTGESVDKIRNTIALNNLIPELQHLLNSDHMSDKKRKDNSDGTRTKQESLGQGIAISIARNGVDDDGKPNGTIQRKAFTYANQNRGATPSQVADYIKTLKSQNFSFGGGIDEKGRSREQQEALRNVGGDEGKAHANASKAESFIKDTHNALSKLFGASTGEIDPKLMKELTNSIVGARGEGKAQSLQDHIDTMVKTLVAARDMIKNNLGEIKGNASMDDMFAFGKSTLWKQRVLHELNYRIHLARKLK